MVQWGVDETTEWCNSFCHSARTQRNSVAVCGTSKAQPDTKMPNAQGLTLNDIPSKLTRMHYMTMFDASSGNHSLKCDKISSYLTTFA